LTQLTLVMFGPQTVIADEFNELGADRVLVFGSWAARYHGEVGPVPADIDVLLLGDGLDGAAVYAAAERAEARLGMPVNPVLRPAQAWIDPGADPLLLEVQGLRRRDRATVMTWTRGRTDVDQLLADRRLEYVTGAAADGTALLRSAEALLESAHREAESNTEAAYVLAYDAARKAATSLVAQQGLRAKSGGHHVTVESRCPRPVRWSLRRLRSAAPTKSGDRVPAAAGRRHRGPRG
jgi:hypothetical protein